jgi:hypothetical protein
MRTTVRLPPDLLQRAKRHAHARGTTVTALIEAGLRLVVDTRATSQTRQSEPKQSVPTYSGGWLLDEIDPDAAIRQVEEEDEIENFARIARQ